MLNPIGLTHGHYECRALDETLPIFTDLLAMQVLERGKGQAVVRHPNTSWRLVVHEGGDAVSMGWTRRSDIAACVCALTKPGRTSLPRASIDRRAR